MSVCFIATTYFINPICFYLSPIALGVVLFYSFTKRFTSLCHIVLGIGQSLVPIGAYLAVSGEFALIPIIFSFIVLGWMAGFDILYALQDEEFDRGQSLHSIPEKFGRKNALLISRKLQSSIVIIMERFPGHIFFNLIIVCFEYYFPGIRVVDAILTINFNFVPV